MTQHCSSVQPEFRRDFAPLGRVDSISELYQVPTREYPGAIAGYACFVSIHVGIARSNEVKQQDRARCHVCLEQAPLTREHVPPKAALNQSDQLWESLRNDRIATGEQRRVHVKGGYRVRSLCQECNTGVCSSYAKEYGNFIKYLDQAPVVYDAHGLRRLLAIPFDRLKLAKQIATQILAINFVGFAEAHPELREFVLKPTKKVKPSFSVLAFLVSQDDRAGTIQRFEGRMTAFGSGIDFLGGEISWYPFGFVYVKHISWRYRPDLMTDITGWFDGSVETTSKPETFSTRLTGVGSRAEGLGFLRQYPQLDYP